MLRTTLLLGAMTGLIMAIGQYMGGSGGLMIAFARNGRPSPTAVSSNPPISDVKSSRPSRK